MFKSDSTSLQSEAYSTDTFNQDRTYAYQFEWVSVICDSLFHGQEQDICCFSSKNYCSEYKACSPPNVPSSLLLKFNFMILTESNTQGS